jgi:hypothetical protein
MCFLLNCEKRFATFVIYNYLRWVLVTYNEKEIVSQDWGRLHMFLLDR